MPADPFANLPVISFCDVDVTALQRAVIIAFQQTWLDATGEVLTLTLADRRTAFLYSLVAYLVRERMLIDASAKQNLLPYSSGGFLDNLAALYGARATRLQPSAATTTLQFKLPTPSVGYRLFPLAPRFPPAPMPPKFSLPMLT